MLDINWVAVLTQSIGFILLVVFLGRVGFKPIGAVIESRQTEIQTTLDQIAADRQAMEQTRAEYEQRLANIESEARETIVAAVKEAQAEAAGILAKAREESEAQREQAVAEIDLERRKALSEIRSQMSELAVQAASKVLDREINPAVHRELINNFISEVSPN